MTARTPENLKALSGTQRGDRAGAYSQVALPPLEAVPPAPDFLPNGHAVREWRRLAPILVANRLLTAGNLHALALLCGLHGRVLQLWSASEAPAAALVSQYRALLADLGLLSMRLPQSPPGPHNRFASHGKAPGRVEKPGGYCP